MHLLQIFSQRIHTAFYFLWKARKQLFCYLGTHLHYISSKQHLPCRAAMFLKNFLEFFTSGRWPTTVKRTPCPCRTWFDVRYLGDSTCSVRRGLPLFTWLVVSFPSLVRDSETDILNESKVCHFLAVIPLCITTMHYSLPCLTYDISACGNICVTLLEICTRITSNLSRQPLSCFYCMFFTMMGLVISIFLLQSRMIYWFLLQQMKILG